MKKRRVFDRTGGLETFRRMAVELSHAKGSVQESARELGRFEAYPIVDSYALYMVDHMTESPTKRRVK